MEKKYQIIIGQGKDAIEAANALEEEINGFFNENPLININGAPFVLESNPEGVTLAQCILR